MFIDESHVSLPQVRGMYNGDRARKDMLVQYGFRMNSAYDNRPLKFDEFSERVNQVVYVSATPSEYEVKKADGLVVEQIVRPTGLLDPDVLVKPVEGQVEDLLAEIQATTEKGYRVLVTTLTKKLAEAADGVLRGGGHKGPLPAFGYRHAGAHGDHPEPAPRGVRRACGHQPAARRP